MDLLLLSWIGTFKKRRIVNSPLKAEFLVEFFVMGRNHNPVTRTFSFYVQIAINTFVTIQRFPA